MQLYLKDNQVFIKSRNTTYSENYSLVSVVNAFDRLSSANMYVYVVGIPNWDEKRVINVLQTRTEDNILYTENTFDQFLSKLIIPEVVVPPVVIPPDIIPENIIIQDKVEEGVKDIAPSQDAVFREIKKVDEDKMDKSFIWSGTRAQFNQLTDVNTSNKLYIIKKQ